MTLVVRCNPDLTLRSFTNDNGCCPVYWDCVYVVIRVWHYFKYSRDALLGKPRNRFRRLDAQPLGELGEVFLAQEVQRNTPVYFIYPFHALDFAVDYESELPIHLVVVPVGDCGRRGGDNVAMPRYGCAVHNQEIYRPLIFVDTKLCKIFGH